jgi:hypothetical protein
MKQNVGPAVVAAAVLAAIVLCYFIYRANTQSLTSNAPVAPPPAFTNGGRGASPSGNNHYPGAGGAPAGSPAAPATGQ